MRFKLSLPRIRVGSFSTVFLIAMPIIMILQLVLTNLTAEDAYKLAGLKKDLKNINLELAIITEEIDAENNPYNIAAKAEELGMVVSDTAVFIDIVNDKLYGMTPEMID